MSSVEGRSGLHERGRRVELLRAAKDELADVAAGRFRVRNPVRGSGGVFDQVCGRERQLGKAFKDRNGYSVLPLGYSRTAPMLVSVLMTTSPYFRTRTSELSVAEELLPAEDVRSG